MTTVDERLRAAVPPPPTPDIEQIIARGRRRCVVRRAVSVGAIALIPMVLVAGGIFALNRSTGTTVVASDGGRPDNASPTTSVSADGLVTVNLVTPRGARLEVSYPEQMRLLERDRIGNAALEWPVRGPDARGDICCSRSVTLIYDDEPSGLERLTEEEGTYVNADGRTGRLLEAPESVPLERSGPYGPRVLVFDYYGITAVVSLRPDPTDPMSMTDDELETFAASFSLEAADGSAVLRPRSPVTVGPIDSPDLVFGGGVVGLLVRECTRLGQPIAATQSGADIYDSDAGYVLCFANAGVEAVINTEFPLDIVTQFDIERS